MTELASNFVRGYAVAGSDGLINVRTVSTTARGAMAKWLGVECRIPVTASSTDKWVVDMFLGTKTEWVHLVPVAISEIIYGVDD